MPSQSGLRMAPNQQKIKNRQWGHNFPTLSNRPHFFRRFCFSCQFSYWSKFHVNIIPCSGVMTIFFYKGLTTNLEISNTTIWVSSNFWRMGVTSVIKNLAWISLRKCYWILKDSRVRAFTVFELLKENRHGGRGGLQPLTY